MIMFGFVFSALSVFSAVNNKKRAKSKEARAEDKSRP
jgi:hypothetical protein